MTPSNIVQKLWNYCNVLRDDGMSYGDYVEAAPAHLGNCSCVALPSAIHGGRSARGIRTSCSAQLTFALTLALSQGERGLKGTMADERTKAPYNQKNPVPEIDWP